MRLKFQKPDALNDTTGFIKLWADKYDKKINTLNHIYDVLDAIDSDNTNRCHYYFSMVLDTRNAIENRVTAPDKYHKEVLEKWAADLLVEIQEIECKLRELCNVGTLN